MEETRKNFSRFYVFLIFFNFIVVIGIIGYLGWIAKQKTNVGNNTENQIANQEKDKNKKNEVQIIEPQIILKDREYVIQITDDGYLNKGIQAVGGQKMNFTVINNGTKPHSFDIESLNISSGPMDAGETKSFTVESVPDENTSIGYRSSVEGDSSEAFSGVLVVIKK